MKMRNIVAIFWICLIVIYGLYFFKFRNIHPNEVPTNTQTGSVSESNFTNQYTVDYTSVMQDWTVVDTTNKNIAIENNLWHTGSQDNYYTPQKIVLGQGIIQKQLEDSIKSMKVWETRTVTLEPKYAYGEKITPFETSLNNFKYALGTTTKDKLISVGNKDKDIFVGGKVLIGEWDKKWEIVKILWDVVQIKTANPSNPFKKDIKADMTARLSTGNDIRIVSVDNKWNVKAEIINNNKFAWQYMNVTITLLGIDKIDISSLNNSQK